MALLAAQVAELLPLTIAYRGFLVRATWHFRARSSNFSLEQVSLSIEIAAGVQATF